MDWFLFFFPFFIGLIINIDIIVNAQVNEHLQQIKSAYPCPSPISETKSKQPTQSNKNVNSNPQIEPSPPINNIFIHGPSQRSIKLKIASNKIKIIIYIMHVSSVRQINKERYDTNKFNEKIRSLVRTQGNYSIENWR